MNDLIKTGKQVLTFAVVFSTIAWSVGLGALALPLAANAVTLASGDLIKGSGTAVYYYGNDAKRYVFPYAASYNSWYTGFGTVKTLGDAELIAIPFGGNVTAKPGRLAQVVSMDTPWAVMDSKVYAIEKGGVLRWVKSAAIASAIFGATWESQIVAVPESLLTNYTIGAEINAASDYTLATQQAVASINEDKGLVGGGTGAAGTLAVALASDTPAAASVPKSAADVSFTKVNLTAGSSDVSVTALKVTRTGLGIDSNLASVKIYVDGVQRGTSQSLGSTHLATFTLTSNPIVVPANSTVAVVLGANIAATNTYDQHILGIANATDVTTTATVTGSFPVNGNVMSLANVTIGTATLYNGPLHPTADTGVDPDKEDFRFTQLKVTAGSTEGLIISQITAVKNGTAANTDVKNIELYNDTTGATVATVEALNSDGRAVFQDLNIVIAKGGNLELSVRADMNGGSGRTIAFDLHDGTSYTIMVKGATYNVGITPTRNNFCAANGTCQTQAINQGYLTVSKSASAPATGKIASGGTGVSLMAFDYTVAGEPINVSQTVVNYTTVGATVGKFTNWTLYKADGTVLAGPKDRDATIGDAVGTDTVTFTDAYTLPSGTTVVYAKADVSSATVATNTVHLDMAVNKVTAKGANSGKTTYTTTSAGTTVPPSGAITGNTMTVQGPALNVTTTATPITGNMVVNAQNQVFAYFDLDASAGGEDIRVSSITVTDTLGGGAAAYTGLNNLELWGDRDTSDVTAENVQIATSNSTATNGATTVFTFQTPIIVSKTVASRLTLMMDIVVGDVDGGGVADTHTFKIVTPNVTATGKSTGTAATMTYNGAGQAQALQPSGTLKVEKAADMPSAVQIASSTTGVEVMKYKFTSAYEPIDVTEFGIFCGDNTQGGVACTLANVSKVYVYADGVLVGNTSGYTLNAAGTASVVLPSGTLVIPKDSSKYVSVKIDVSEKAQVTTSTGANVQIGLSSTVDAGTTDSKDARWSVAAHANNDYKIVATGYSSGATIPQTTINSVGTIAASQVFGSNGMSIHKGVLTVSLNASSPSGTQTGGTNKEILRLNLTATGDDVTLRELELVSGGTVTISGTGGLTVKSEDDSTTYATATGAQCGVYNGADGGDICLLVVAAPAVSYNAISIGPNGCTQAAADATGDSCTTGWTSANNLQVGAGTTKVIKIFGDTTGAASAKTYQAGISNASTNKATTYGVVYRDSSNTDIGNRTGSANSTHPATKNLPLSGGSLSY